MELKHSVLWNSPSILTIEEFSYAFTGGAHGNYGTGYYNFNAHTGQLVKLEDILTSGYEAPLTKIAATVFKETYLEEGMTNYSEAGFYFEKDAFTMTDNFALTKDGLKFVYNPYEIAPYAMGQQEILIPYNDLRNIIHPEGALNHLFSGR